MAIRARELSAAEQLLALSGTLCNGTLMDRDRSSSLDRPVLVTGTPRSGKTCISQILAQAPEFFYLEEPITLWETGLGIRRRADDRRTADEATAQVRQHISAVCERAVREAGRQRYLDDLSYHALRIPFLYSVLPNMRIIHVVRDARIAVPEIYHGWTRRGSFGDVLQTCRQQLNFRALPRQGYRFAKNYLWNRLYRRRAAWGPRVPGLQAFAAAHSQAEVAGYQWAKMTEIARADLHALLPTAWLEVRFEDLLREPYSTAQRIAAFVQVESPDALASFADSYMDSRHDGFLNKVEPTAQEWATILELTRPMQQSLGYPLSANLTETPTYLEITVG